MRILILFTILFFVSTPVIHAQENASTFTLTASTASSIVLGDSFTINIVYSKEKTDKDILLEVTNSNPKGKRFFFTTETLVKSDQTGEFNKSITIPVNLFNVNQLGTNNVKIKLTSGDVTTEKVVQVFVLPYIYVSYLGFIVSAIATIVLIFKFRQNFSERRENFKYYR